MIASDLEQMFVKLTKTWWQLTRGERRQGASSEGCSQAAGELVPAICRLQKGKLLRKEAPTAVRNGALACGVMQKAVIV